MSERGRPFIVAAPSGTGKTTVCRKALERDPQLRFSVSHTTRTPRKGEVDGEDYYFVDREEFERLVARDVFLEHAEFNGNWYGTSIEALEAPLASGLDLIVEIEVQGAQQLKARLSDGCFVFLLPPSMATLRERLAKRGTDTEEAMTRRLSIANTELEAIPYFDYVIVNDDLEVAVASFLEVIHATRAGDTRAVEEAYGRPAAYARWHDAQRAERAG